MRPGELLGVVGEVGAGKSSLLLALLGELQPLSPELQPLASSLLQPPPSSSLSDQGMQTGSAAQDCAEAGVVVELSGDGNSVAAAAERIQKEKLKGQPGSAGVSKGVGKQEAGAPRGPALCGSVAYCSQVGHRSLCRLCRKS